MKIGVGVFKKRKGLRKRPNIAPIPFSYRAVIAKIVSRDHLNPDLDDARDSVFVRIRTAANDESRNSYFTACRATMKIMDTRLRVGTRGRNFRNRQQRPLPIAKSHQVSSGRSGFGHQSARQCCQHVGISSRRMAFNIFLSMQVRRNEDCYCQKRTSPHISPWCVQAGT